MSRKFLYDPNSPNTGAGNDTSKIKQGDSIADESSTAGDLDGGGGVGGGVAGEESDTGGGVEAAPESEDSMGQRADGNHSH